MAPRIRTALLGTVMASGLFLSPVAAQALPIEDTAIATTAPGQPAPTTGTAPAEGTTGELHDGGQVSSDPSAAKSVVIAADTDGTEMGQTSSEVDPAQESPEAINLSATETHVPDSADEAGLNPSPSVESSDPGASDDFIAAEEPELMDTAPADVDSPVGTVNQVLDQVSVPTVTADSGGTEETGTNETVEEAASPLVTEESTDEPEMPSWFPAITMPDGSEAWDEDQWNEFLDSDDGQAFIDDYSNAMLESPEFQTIFEILTDFLNTGDESYLDELRDYLKELFPDNPEWAQEVFDGIMAGIGEGEPAETDPPELATPTDKPQKPAPEIKPAATVTKPVLQKKPVAQALARPIIESRKDELAATGSDGTLVIGGVGAMLLLGGALTLGMRRRQKGL